MLSFLYFVITSACILNSLLGLVVIRRARSIVHVTFAIFAFLTSIWNISNLFLLYNTTIFSLRITYSIGALVMAASLSWIIAFSRKNKKWLYLSYVFGLSAFGVGLTPYVVKRIINFDISGQHVIYGPLYILFSMWLLVTLIIDIIIILNSNKINHLNLKSQSKFVVLGIILFGGVALITSAFLPLLGYQQLMMLDSPSSLFFVGFSAYAIVKHRLLDIRLLVLKSVAYSLTFALVVAGYISATVFIFQRLSPAVSPLTLNVITLFILVFTFNPFRLFIERSTDKLFAKGRYNPAVLWRALDEINITYARQEDLTKRWLTTITEQMRISRAAFALMSSPISHIDSLNYEEKPLVEWQKLAVIMIGNDKTIVFDELEEGAPERDILREFNTEVLMPIKTKTRTIGMLVLGEKNSGDMYNNQDLNLLEDFVHRAAVALERSKELRQKEKEVVKVRALYNQAEKSISSTDLEYVLNATIDAAFMATDSDGGSIMLIDVDGGLIVKASRGISNEYKEKKIKMGEGIAGSIAETRKPRIIDNKDKELAKFLKRDQIYSAMCVPLEARGKLIGVLSVNRINNKAHFIRDDLDLVTTIAANIAQRIDNAKLVEEDRSRNKEVINIYAAAAEARDPHTYGHSEAVTRYAVAIAKEMALPVEEIRKIEHAGILHDIGKIGISDQVLNKPGRLTPEERELICKHPLIGDKLIRQYSNLDDIAPIALHHHENYDGKGYPSGIAGEVIPRGARILAVADAFDAMTSDRPYRTALSLPEAKAELRKNRGTQFDPQAVNAFLKIANTIFNREKRLRKQRPADIIRFPTATLQTSDVDELVET